MRDFFSDQFMKLEITPVDLAGKTIIVTGANVGIGYGTVCHLVGMNPERIILACRNLIKAEEAIRNIKASFPTEGVIIEAQELDLASFASIRAFAKKYQESGLPLHILIDNAGTTLLTLLLLPVIRKTVSQNDSTYPRIIVVASEMHHWSNFPEKDTPNIIETMDDPNNAASFKNRYPLTKLMNLFFARSLASHLQESNHPEDRKITVQVLNPGLVSSEFGNKGEPLIKRFARTAMLFVMRALIARNIMEGAKTSVYAATAPECGIEHGAQSGQYYSSCRVAKINPILEGEAGKELGERLWKETIQTIEITPHEFDI
ncbi:hypothetical protein BGZ83_006505 [Gryganskiella cystojenkinii]|nr:hypothetical protein BGZ83_006505 [Gryganskiella cystojenkinii]